MNKISLVACARWESEHIYEWISYHLLLGVDHIYLYCNDDNPLDMYQKVAVFCGGVSPKVTFLHYPFQGEQWKMYLHYLEHFKGNSEFVCFLDIDEFITLKLDNSISEYLSRFNHIEWDMLFFNWVNFGHNNYEVRPSGLVLENYLKRSARISHITKVIVRSQSISNEYIRRNPTPFWHGRDWEGKTTFNYNLKMISAIGTSFSDFMDKWWKNSNADDVLKIENQIFNTAYVSHFFFKSYQDIQRRIERGTGGNFSGQWDWLNKAKEPEKLKEYFDSLNEVEDDFLKKTWKNLNQPKVINYFIPPALGKNLSEGCKCDQSSVDKEWAGDPSDKKLDACRPVNLPINGQHKHHTELEQNPWWCIDLGEIKIVKEIRLFHREIRDHEIKRFSIQTTSDKNVWCTIFETKDDLTFGGMDGRPFILKPINLRCRYIKIVLNHYGALHFDRVEIY